MSARAAIRFLFLLLLVAGLLVPAGAASAVSMTFVVNSTVDDVDGGGCQPTPDDCTLREAITAANANAGFDKIHFALGAGVPTIDIATDLPQIADRVTINGNTGGASRVEISGPVGVDSLDGLVITGLASQGSIVRRLVVNQFGDVQIQVFGVDNVTLTGNWIGLDETGLAVADGGQYGIFIDEASGAEVGTNTPGGRNVVAGTALSGIVIVSSFGDEGSNTVLGNYIGLDRNGVGNLGNLGVGVLVLSSNDDAVVRNVFGGNDGGAVFLDEGAIGTLVALNRMGMNVNDDPVPNGAGIAATDTAQATFEQNRIDHNDFIGIDLGGFAMVTPNDNADADDGPNGLVNFPVITRADVLTNGMMLIRGRVRTLPDVDITVELFSSPACSVSGHGEGNTALTSLELHTDSAGRVSFGVEVLARSPGSVVTATTTSAEGTSEFSQCRTVVE